MLSALTMALSLALVQASPASAAPTSVVPGWDARRAEHLWNRAGFGAGTAEVEQSVALGPERMVAELLTAESWIEQPFYARKRADADLSRYFKTLPQDERDRKMDELRSEDRAQMDDYLDWWVGRMLTGEEPLRERMVLFWHGHFTSSMDAVHSSYEMIQQNQLFRRLGLGSFRALLFGVARDPAMLLYLDNASSKKAHPNENFARELLELYTLGEGNYGEEDVREVARAFTGWGQENGRFVFDEKRHDDGQKRVLGVEGHLNGDDVLDILLKQPACARHLAHALLAYFEGVEPTRARLENYAAFLRESDWRIDAFLRRLFLDPEFYAEDKLGARVASPLDFLVGSARRLGLRPPAAALVSGASLLGQRLFFPPSVRGWEGGETWATGGSLILRGELAGFLLGRVRGRELLGERLVASDGDAPATPAPAPMEAAGERRNAGKGKAASVPADLRAIARMDLRPQVNLTARLTRGDPTDGELARALLEELLATPVPPALATKVEERITRARGELGLGDATWISRPELCEPLLRELAHDVLALPEAQLD